MVTPVIFPNGGFIGDTPCLFPGGGEESLSGLRYGESVHLVCVGVVVKENQSFDLLLHVFKQDYMFRQAIRSKKNKKQD